MKGKKITSVNPLIGVLGALSMTKGVLLGKDVSGRPTAMTDEIGDITVDTCVPSDTGVWETGIERMSVEGKWVIVSQYETEEEAKEEHKGWVELMKKDPTCELCELKDLPF